MTRIIAAVVILNFCFLDLTGQMRRIHEEQFDPDNELVNFSFYSNKEGYGNFLHSGIAYTQDTGRTYISRAVTLNNVDFGNYYVNITFGFTAYGSRWNNHSRIFETIIILSLGLG